MAKRRSQEYRETDKFLKLQTNARARYVYFICRRTAGARWHLGYWWELIGPNDELLCQSEVFDNRADCLKCLRKVQQHASTTQVRDDER